jgi:hypothetical protein
MRRIGLLALAVVLAAGAVEAGDLAALRARYEREKDLPTNKRLQVLREIKDVGTEDAAKLLIRIAERDVDRSIRSNAVFWLGYVQRPAARHALLRFYRDGPEELRGSAFNALANGGHPMPEDIVREVLASSDLGRRSTIVRYLQRRDDPRFLPEAKRFLADFPKSETSLISTLVAAKSAPAARLLVRIYDDTRRYDRDNVPKVFAEGDDAVRAVLVEVLSGRVSVRELENAAILAGRAKVTEAEPAVVEALPGAREPRRVLLIETIGRLGGTTVLGRQAIRDAIDDRSPAIRLAAVRAARGAPDRLMIPKLIELLRREGGPLAQEIRVTLERITGQQLGDRVDLWERWWKEHGEAFRIDDVRKPDPDALDQALVDLAIDKGAAALRKLRGDSPPWVYASHPTGTTALVVLALHASGADRKDRDLRAGVKYLLETTLPDRTYDLGCVAMALETVGGRRYRRRIGECAKRLLSTQLPAGLWCYPNQNGEGDNSNTQYAVLGLRHAARAGIRIPPKVWRGVRRHFLSTQSAKGGWTYPGRERSEHDSASMTAAGVCCLLVCLENEKIKAGSAEEAELLAAIDRGFDALGEAMKLDKDSLYALYGIERAGVLGRRSVMKGKPWYVPGARRLVDEQGRDGSWRGNYHATVDTAFAILFLKRATAPITGR